ncbi:hypothetical protein M413DRAFT_444332 [Hebeloma cylindrosporum]|uniref:Uncharacterized protein n=1 Tax=Hebeloma cylindrosporum TaxID=76867 RepID=A0A0C3C1B5_HEBCY|nr:hypothetical protein M413DRAFT_444332 [Hebeloma cylindrosporum h7]
MDQSSNKPMSLSTTPPQRNSNSTAQPSVLRSRRIVQVPMLRSSVRGEQPQAMSLEQHMRNLQPFTTSQKLNPAHLAIANNLTEQHTVAESVDAAFNVYGERLHADLRDFRSLCSTLVLKEQNEKEQWHTLCLKVMRERDMARQRVLELQSAVQRSSSPPDTNRPSKRLHDSEEKDVEPESPSRSNSCESRPICSLRASPVHSPPGSPYQSSRPASVPPSAPPESPASATSSSASAPPSSASSATTPSEPPFGPPIKRRKSCEAPAPAPARKRKPAARPMAITDSRATIPAMNPAEGGSLPFEFAHVDLMYLPVEGNNFVCRPCLFQSKKSQPPTEPTSFPVTSTWNEMRDHVILSHPAACVEVARLHPAQIFELRRRLSNPNLLIF